MKFLKLLGNFIVGWLAFSIPTSLVIGVVGARGTYAADLVQVSLALLGGIGAVIYKLRK
jgi:hypothetical protein